MNFPDPKTARLFQLCNEEGFGCIQLEDGSIYLSKISYSYECVEQAVYALENNKIKMEQYGDSPQAKQEAEDTLDLYESTLADIDELGFPISSAVIWAVASYLRSDGMTDNDVKSFISDIVDSFISLMNNKKD